MSGDGDLWSLLVPVKRLDIAKTRLALAADARADLALAMAIDTVTAGLATPAVAEVVVITDDQRAARALSVIGARVVSDRPDAGLNPALVHGASLAGRPRVVALSSDLPALRSDDFDGVLGEAAAHPMAVVADVVGTGTTLLAARLHAFAPAFGLDSLAAHLAAGAVDLSESAATSVRQDVDTIAALHAAIALGVGAETTRVLARLEIPAT